MATPIMTAANFNAQVVPGSAGRFRIDTLDADGAALDVSSGYTLDYFKASPASDDNSLNGPVDLVAQVTATFNATGVTLSYTAAQASAIAAALPTLRSNAGVGLSNDSSATASLAATGSITVIADVTFQA